MEWTVLGFVFAGQILAVGAMFCALTANYRAHRLQKRVESLESRLGVSVVEQQP